MTKLRTIVSAEVAVAEELPLVHTTRCDVLPHIVTSHELRGGECDVFHEHLVYFFYGRPAYRTSGGSKPAGDLDPCPVCFVFKPHTIGSGAKRVFPCDTGALSGGNFENHLYATDRDDVELDATIDSARKLVPLVFGDNSRYFFGNVTPTLPGAFPPGTAAARFHALLTDTGPLQADDRRSVIEVQLDSPVALEHHLLYVILPRELLNQAGTREAILQIWQADPIGYDIYNHRQPHEYRTTICDIVKERFKQGGRL